MIASSSGMGACAALHRNPDRFRLYERADDVSTRTRDLTADDWLRAHDARERSAGRAERVRVNANRASNPGRRIGRTGVGAELSDISELRAAGP